MKTEGIMIWPVYVNYSLEEWPQEEMEYAKQSVLGANQVLLMNSITDDPVSYGGAFFFKDGKIEQKLQFGKEDILVVEL